MTREQWTTQHIPDLTGKKIIVTGGNSGIGFEAAKEFARNGAHTILACRNLDKASTALTQLQAEIPHAKAEVMQLDLSSLASIRNFANTFLHEYDRLDVLVNNAGIMMVPYGTTEDGFELQVGTNHLGHFALTGLLLDVLLKTPDSRVATVSSSGHRSGNVDFDNLLYDNGKDYTPFSAYGRSKLANLLFTHELQRRLDAMGANTIAVAAHPGVSTTNLGNHLGDGAWYWKLLMPIMTTMAQSSTMGAMPTMRAAVAEGINGGEYYGPGGFMEMRGAPVKVASSAGSHNVGDARRLWDISEELTSIHYKWE